MVKHVKPKKDEWAMDINRVAIRQTGMNPIDKSQSTCFNCGKKGHWAQDCRSPRQSGYRKGKGKGKRNPKRKGKGRRIRSTEMDEDGEEDVDDNESEEDQEVTREIATIRSMISSLTPELQRNVRKGLQNQGF